MKWLKVFCALFILIALSIWVSLYTPIVTNWVILSKLQKAMPAVDLTGATVNKQSFVFPSQFLLRGVMVSGTIKDSGKPFSVRVPFLDVRLGTDLVFLNAGGVEAAWDALTVQGAELELALRSQDGQSTAVTGSVVTGPVKWADALYFSDFSTGMSGSLEQMHFTNIMVKGYGGIIGGQADVSMNDDKAFDLRLKCANLETKAFLPAYSSLSGFIDGTLNGAIELEGRDAKVDGLRLDLFLLKGGRLKASLLELVSIYVPILNQVTKLEQLVKNDAMFEVEKTTLKLTSSEYGLLTGEVQVFSEQLFLNLTVPVNIKYDGTLSALLHEWINALSLNGR